MSEELEEVAAAIEELGDVLKKAPAPVVNVGAPQVSVKAPQVTVTPHIALKKEFTSYTVSVTDRDRYGHIKTLTIRPDLT